MNREIKFRAWHKKAKEYRVIETIDFDYIKQKGRADCITTRDNNTLHDPWDDVIEEVELEQYTGLKDKNGKEIYEGDIVKRVEDGGFDIVGAVEWSEKAARFWVKRYYYPNGKKWEVIGNIHENPELLEMKND